MAAPDPLLVFDRNALRVRRERAAREWQARSFLKREIANRLVEYAEKTAPLVDFYGAQGKLVGIDATGPVEEITSRAMAALRPFVR